MDLETKSYKVIGVLITITAFIGLIFLLLSIMGNDSTKCEMSNKRAIEQMRNKDN